VPDLGAIPAILTDLRDRPRFDFVPTAEADFDAICATFDAVDNGWLKE
jgi:hypothetical protein